jgi:site-specific DNA-methyltransferase (adenine-specific)
LGGAVNESIKEGGEELKVNSLPTPYYQDDWVTIYHADCRDILPLLPKVDLVLTDPPYGVGKADWDVLPPLVLRLAWGLTTGAMLVFWSAFDLETVPREVGEKYKNVIVWWKPNLPALWTWDRSRLASQWEPIFYFARKGFEPKERPTDVWPCNYPSNNNQRFHPTQKPIPILTKALTVFGGETILDPFMGSGTTLRAAKDLKRHAIGIEIEEKYCEIAARRMAREVLI